MDSSSFVGFMKVSARRHGATTNAVSVNAKATRRLIMVLLVTVAVVKFVIFVSQSLRV